MKLVITAQQFTLLDDVKAKHKFAAKSISQGEKVIMYGSLVGVAQDNLLSGNLLHTENIKHAANGFSIGQRKTDWNRPDVSQWRHKTFNVSIATMEAWEQQITGW
jgi:altronate hydrolase